MNICGCLVHVAQDALPKARAQIEALDGTEVHAQSDDGRLVVVVVEDTDTAFASDIIMSLHQIRGVISLTINYHHFEEPPQRPSPAAPQPET
ncbi:chaperone NapD [Alloyangia pacifica]|uniref:chaperone NapD n=1 Tax=Alloyangia pacifica TaxID=311180 RepID=UPI0031D436C3